jgi:PPIC-type peptidyl-prolyl cis-trans isomerase-like protein/parvulin-like peptidyl-prolyl cis-trans isomerase-like protein
MNIRRFSVGVLAALASFGAGCKAKPAAAPPAAAVATYEGGAVTAAEVDQAILDLAPGQRQPADGDLLKWYEQIARDLAIERVLVAEARQAGLDRGPDYERAREEARRQAAVSIFLEKNSPPPPAPTAGEVEAYYREHAKDFSSPASRQVYYLFRRVAPGADPSPVVAEVRRLRERVVAGEDFGKLAAEFSESETRHQKGLLGWVVPGKVSPDLEKVIFSLEPRVPSQPLKTATGVHLFLVAQAIPAKTLTLAEVRAAIGQVLSAQRRQAAVDKLIGDPLEGTTVASAEELRALFAAGDPAATALRAGDYQLTVGQLQARLLAGQQAIVAPGDTPAHSLLVTLEKRERAYRLAQKQGLDRGPEAEALIQRSLDREIGALQLHKRMAARIDADPRRLQEYYEANRARFSTPLRLKVQRLSVPLAGDANQTMARLERARQELDAGRLAISRLAADLGGTVTEPAWELPTQVARRERRPVATSVGLKPGKHGAPYRIEDRIEMLRVLERSEPSAQPLDQIRDQVRTDLLVTHREDEYTALVQEILSARKYAVVRTELEAMLKRPVSSGG